MKNLCKTCANFVRLNKMHHSGGLCNQFDDLILQRLQIRKQVFVIQCDKYDNDNRCPRCLEQLDDETDEAEGCRDPWCPRH